MSSTLRNILLWILLGTKGGIRRATIINALKERPMTASQLQRMMGLNYKTVRYHLDLLLENGLIETTGKRYGQLYIIAPLLEADYEVFLGIWDIIENGKDY
jgi:predicted transcriptional regulator